MKRLLKLGAVVVAVRAALAGLPALAAGLGWVASRLREAADLAGHAARFLSGLV